MVCFDNAQKHNLYITCLINKKKSEAYKDSFKSKQNMINSLPAFTNYTDIRNALADNEVVSVQRSLSSVMILLIK